MARLRRYYVPGQPQHLIQRGNDRGAVFFDDEDYALYREWLAEAARANGVAVHAYVLMTNHVHILATPRERDGISRTMQALGRRYVRHVNRSHRRTGKLWEGRYRAAAIDADDYFFACCRYIELNPVRARLAAHPRAYPWSSYRAHAEGKDDALAAWHPVFARLGRSRDERAENYRALFKRALDETFVEALRTATNGGWALGDERFRAEIARAAKRRVAPLPRGRKPEKLVGKRDPRQRDLFAEAADGGGK
jgi:putative transposase